MAANTYLIRGAAILGGAAEDLLIRDGVIAARGNGLAAGDATVIDAAGLIALPGMVDVHTHLREPGREDAETVETGTVRPRWVVSPPSTPWRTAIRWPTPPVWWSRSTAWEGHRAGWTYGPSAQ